MRIRGRGPPPPPPDLPSSPLLSQLHHGNDQSVQSLGRNPSPPPLAGDRRASDLRVETDGLIPSDGEGAGAKKDQEIGVGEEEGRRDEMRFSSPSNRRGTNSTPSPEPSAVMEHWLEEDRTIPLKKRRPTFEMETMTEKIKAEKAKNRMVRVRRKRPKKWTEEDEREENGIMARNNGKKGRSGTGNGIILEGSRCSRVNGRGWRCHQQTLVGYSLCEHHLGKGRLKSMTSVRNSPLTAPALHKPTKPEINTEEEDESESDGYEGTMAAAAAAAKKGKKIGGVKARSMSSLLGQTVTSPVLPVTLELSNGNCDI